MLCQWQMLSKHYLPCIFLAVLKVGITTLILYIMNLTQRSKKQVSVSQFSQFSSVTQLCPTPCDPMNHSTPGHYQLPEFTQTHVD